MDTAARILSHRARCFSAIQRYLVDGALELLRSWDARFECAPAGEARVAGRAVMAVIGFASDHVRGSLLLLTSPCLVRSLRPAGMAMGPLCETDLLRDVLGEFANMLLGRLKNKLARHAVEPLLSTPTSVFGDDLVLPDVRSGMAAWHTFRAGGFHRFFVRFAATFDEEFELAAGAGGDLVLREGEMVMFDVEEVKE